MSDLELACSLDPEQLYQRRQIWEALARAALEECLATSTGARLVYDASDEAERVLRRLAELEAECCSFAQRRVDRTNDKVLLDVSSTGEGVAAVRSLFGLFARGRR